MRILLAEDQDVGRRLMRELLELEGHIVWLAPDGVEAVEMARDLRPDLILMDIHMPRLDGIQATRQLRDDPATSPIPVIALTAGASLSEIRRALDAGCIGHLSKPIIVSQIAGQMNAWIDARSAPVPA